MLRLHKTRYELSGGELRSSTFVDLTKISKFITMIALSKPPIVLPQIETADDTKLLQQLVGFVDTQELDI